MSIKTISKIQKDKRDNNTTERYNAIDILKFLCCFLIICIHVPFPNEIGKYVVVIARIGVPIFFIISGFFWQITCSQKKQRQRIKKLAILVVVSNLLYFAKIILFQNDPMNIGQMFSKRTLFNFFIFNESPFAGHLWYLSAILYTTIIAYGINKLKINNKVLFILIPVLLIVDLTFGKYSLLIFKREFPFIYVRNFLFVGLPYFLIGNILFKYKEKLKKINIMKYIILIVIALVLNCLERYVLVLNNLNAVRDHYICTTFLSILIFGFCIRINSKVEENLFTKIGKKYSMMIYLIHPLIIWCLSMLPLVVQTNITDIYPIIVFLLSLFFAYIYYYIKNSIISVYIKYIVKI